MFLSVLCMNYLVNMIHNLANLDSEDSYSWQAAKSHLQQERLAHCIISIEQVMQVIGIAEDQNILRAGMQQATASSAKAATANAATAALISNTDSWTESMQEHAIPR
eukprot:3263335-Rhodomonas_salina.2